MAVTFKRMVLEEVVANVSPSIHGTPVAAGAVAKVKAGVAINTNDGPVTFDLWIASSVPGSNVNNQVYDYRGDFVVPPYTTKIMEALLGRFLDAGEAIVIQVHPTSPPGRSCTFAIDVLEGAP